MACAFLTLRPEALAIYLPASTPQPWSACHLNVALPLWQPFLTDPKVGNTCLRSREDFRRALHSSNKHERAHAQSLRDSWLSLRDSPWPEIREYWAKTHQGNRTLERYKRFLSDGAKCNIQVLKGSTAWFGCFNFRLATTRLSLPLEGCDTICIQRFLMETPHPLRYARRALPTDPASRLLLLGKITKDGKVYHDFLSTEGPIAPTRVNVLVDRMEGVTFKEIELSARRTFTKRDEDHKGHRIHT